jgi:monovalent cation:H+ antiporter-2, CPA2 family
MSSALTDILIVLAVALAVTLVFGRLRLPVLVALFVAGALVGPHSFGLIKESENVESLAEIGVIFLLFTLGLEFSFRRLMRLAGPILVGGPVQVIITGGIGAGVALAFGAPGAQAIFLGMLVALSSTAVVLKTLSERGETDSPLGQTSFGILVFQDILVLPMMLVVPLLSGEGLTTSWSPLTIALVAVGVVAALVVGSRWLAPRLLYEAARVRGGDVFLMAVITICFAVAGLAAGVGLSLALGAFLAGLIISEEFSHQALGYVLPFRNLLVSFFFVSVGMLLDLRFLADNWWLVILGTIGLMVVKTIAGTVAVLVLRYPLRVAVGTGLTLSQVGEFSFVLAAVATGTSLLPRGIYQGFLAVAVLSMAVTPIVMGRLPWVFRRLQRTNRPRWAKSEARADAGAGRGGAGRGGAGRGSKDLTGHLLIIGYGLNGRNLARAAREAKVPYAIVELNPQTVRRESAGEPIFFGDAANEGVLAAVRVGSARAAAVVIGDPVATRSIVAQLRRLNPSLHIIARTRFITEVQTLYRLGADDVVPEEFETSIQIFLRTGRFLGLTDEALAELAASIREDNYELLRSAKAPGES